LIARHRKTNQRKEFQMQPHELHHRSQLLHIAATHHDPAERKNAADAVRETYGMSDHDLFLNTREAYMYAALHRIEEKLSATPPVPAAVEVSAALPVEADAFEASVLYHFAHWLWSLFN
jgi:hypothetical protein